MASHVAGSITPRLSVLELLRLRNQSISHGEGDGLQAGTHLELLENILYVRANRIRTDSQASGHPLGAGPLNEEGQYVVLARSDLLPEEIDESLVLGAVIRAPALGGIADDHLTLHRSSDRADELGQGRLLVQIAVETRSQGLLDAPRIPQGGHCDHSGPVMFEQDPSSQVQSIHVREPEIDENHIGSLPGHGFQSSSPILDGIQNPHPRFPQSRGYHLCEELVVLDYEHPSGGSRVPRPLDAVPGTDTTPRSSRRPTPGAGSLLAICTLP